MKKLGIDIKARLRNKYFWVSFVALVVMLLQQLGITLPFDINADGLLERGRQLMDRVEELKGTKSHWSNF